MTTKYDIGSKVGRWTIVSEAERSKNGSRRVNCRCECGTERILYTSNFTKSRSCGCFSADLVRTHGMTHSPEYGPWKHMVSRCTNPNDDAYHRYGGSGINIHEDWVKSLPEFVSYIGPRPSSNHSIDRIDSTKGYIPGNVRWATHREQTLNCRKQRNSSSKYRGLTFVEARSCWQVSLRTSAGTKYLGSFRDEEEAYEHYVKEYIKEHGKRPPYEGVEF